MIRHASRLRRHLGFLLSIGLALALVGAGVALYALRAREAALASQTELAQSLAGSFEGRLSQQLQALELNLQRFEPVPESRRADALRALLSDLPLVGGVALLGFDGAPLATAGAGADRPVVLERLLPLLGAHERRLQIGLPGLDGAVPALRRIGGGALLAATLPPDYFLAVFGERLASLHVNVAVLRDDGQPVFASGRFAGLAGHAALAGATRGALDGLEVAGRAQLAVFQRTPRFPLTLVVGMDRERALAAGRRDLLWMLAFTLPASVALTLLAGVRHLAHRRERARLMAGRSRELSQLLALINALPAQVLMIDQNGYVVRANARWMALAGQSVDPAGEHFTLALRRLYAGQLYCSGELVLAIEAMLRGERTHAQFEQQLTLGGRTLCLHSALCQINESGVSAILLTQTEIGERIEIERARDALARQLNDARRELARQRFALDQHAIVGVADVHGVMLEANPHWLRTSGCSAAQVLGHGAAQFVGGADADVLRDEIMATVSGGHTWHGTLANRRPDGAAYWVEATIVATPDQHGLADGYILIGTDITRQKQAERALAEAQARELATGRNIRRALLLGAAPDRLRGASIASYVQPSQGVDGDFHALAYYGADCFDLMLGDVMGKGVDAALIGAAVSNTYHQVQAELLARAIGGDGGLPQPRELFAALQARLNPRLVALDTFVTLALYRFDRAAGQLICINAGHTPAILLRASGELVVIECNNLPLGVAGQQACCQTQLALATGDALAVHSDGMTAARNGAGEAFGAGRMQTVLAEARRAGLPPATTVQLAHRVLRDFALDALSVDGQAMLMLETQQENAAALADFPLRRDALPALRTFIETHSAPLAPEQADALLLASFEAATNVIHHVPAALADGSLSCRIAAGPEQVCVELFYLGEPFTPEHSALPDLNNYPEGGFGLYIIEHAVDRADYLNPAEGVCCIRLVKYVAAAGVAA